MTDELKYMNLQPQPMPESLAKATQSAQQEVLELQMSVKAAVDKTIMFKEDKSTGNSIPVMINPQLALDHVLPHIPIIAHPSLGRPYEYNYKTGLWEMIDTNLSDYIDKYYLKEWYKEASINPTVFKSRRQLSVEMASYLATEGKDAPISEVTEPEKILFKNGSYNFLTNELTSAQKEDYHTIQLPYNLIPNDEEELETERWLEWVLGESKKTVMQLIGYCLYREYKYAQFTFFINDPKVASGANGKSRVLDFITKILGGKQNYSSVPLTKLTSKTERFAKARLQNHLANIDADSEGSYMEATGDLKALTGGDSIEAEFKGKDSFSFVNYAKLMFSMNKLPKFSDNSFGMHRRITVVPFIKNFSDDAMTPELKAEMLEFEAHKEAREDYEGEEIGKFAWKCIQEFREILFGEFTVNPFFQSERALQLKGDYINENNILNVFLREADLELTKEDKDRVTVSEAKDAYNEWKAYDESSTKWMSMRNRLISEGCEFTRGKVRLKNGEIRNTTIIKGLKWTNEVLDEADSPY